MRTWRITQLKCLAHCRAQRPTQAVVGQIKSSCREKNEGWKHVRPVVRSPVASSCRPVVMARPDPALHLISQQRPCPFSCRVRSRSHPLTQLQSASEVLDTHPSYKLQRTQRNEGGAGGQASPGVSQTWARLQRSKML